MVFPGNILKKYRQLPKTAALALFAAAFFYTPAAQAISVSVPDVATMLDNLTKAVPDLMRLITAIAYVMGMWFIIASVIAFKEFGEQRSASSQHHDMLKKPLILMVVGALLLYLPSSVQVGMNTFWDNPTPYAYVQNTADQWDVLMQDAYMIVQLIGTIALIRGIVMLAQLGGQQGQPVFAKALTHIIGGVLCINLYDFIRTIGNTLGMTVG